tara:strand:- start:621 stop:1637 length:1017 start_codon:yes stop_codon:yes gene_type:complete
LYVEFTPTGAGGASQHGLAEIHQDLGGAECLGNGIVYVLDENASNQEHLSRDATPANCYGSTLYLFEEHGDGLGNWAYGNNVTACAWNGNDKATDEKAFWKMNTCCEVVWVTTRDPETAEVVPETSPLALYIASKITCTWELVKFTADQCCDGSFPPAPDDGPGIGILLPGCNPNGICGYGGGGASSATFTGTGLHIACSTKVPWDGEGDDPNLFLTISSSVGDCNNTDPDDRYKCCLEAPFVSKFIFGPQAGESWCPAIGSFTPGIFGDSGGSIAPRMIYGSCEEIPCVYIGDGNGNWLPFQSCPNIEGQVCVCQPHPTEPSEYAGQMYVTNCGDAQ